MGISSWRRSQGGGREIETHASQRQDTHLRIRRPWCHAEVRFSAEEHLQAPGALKLPFLKSSMTIKAVISTPQRCWFWNSISWRRLCDTFYLNLSQLSMESGHLHTWTGKAWNMVGAELMTFSGRPFWWCEGMKGGPFWSCLPGDPQKRITPELFCTTP